MYLEPRSLMGSELWQKEAQCCKGREKGQLTSLQGSQDFLTEVVFELSLPGGIKNKEEGKDRELP